MVVLKSAHCAIACNARSRGYSRGPPYVTGIHSMRIRRVSSKFHSKIILLPDTSINMGKIILYWVRKRSDDRLTAF